MGRAQQVESLWSGLTNNSGSPLASGTVTSYAAGTSTPKALYTASDKSTSASNPLTLNAYGKSQVWADGAYKFEIRDSGGTLLQTLDNQLYGYDDGQIIYGATSGGTGTAHTITVTGSITAYAAGQRYIYIAGTSNTGSCSLNVNGIGGVSIVKGSGAIALSANDIVSGQVVDVVYDTGGGGRFRLMNYPTRSDIQNSTLTYGGTSGGSGNAQTITLTPAITAYVIGQQYEFIAANPNTGATTLNFNGLGAQPLIYKVKACVGGELQTNVAARVIWDGTSFQLVNHGGGWASFSPTYSASGSMTYTATTTYFRYQIHGKRCDVGMKATGTTAGTASTTLIFTIPIATTNTNGSFPVLINENGTLAYGIGVFSSTTQVSVQYLGASNFGLGVSRSITCEFSYEV